MLLKTRPEPRAIYIYIFFFFFGDISTNRVIFKMIPPSSSQRIDCMLSAVLLFRDRTLRTSKCGKNKKKQNKKRHTRRSVSLMFSPHFDV